MYLNIACSVSGCTNPVIGQCPGYKGSCGRYYCATHSADRLCGDCARRKLEDDIYNDYFQTAERLQRKLRSEMLPISLSVGAIGMGFICVGLSGSSDGLLLFLAGLAIIYGGAIWARIRQRYREKAEVAEISKAKPAFPDFYRAWKKEKNKEALMTGLVIAGVIVAGTIAGAVSAATEDAKRAERVREIEEGVRRAMR